jgi:hypothetical protein
VNKLRQVLGDSTEQPLFVDTIPRKGYSFIGKVDYLDRTLASQSPQASELSSGAAVAEHPNGKVSFFHAAIRSRWFTAGLVALVIASMLLGAALVLYAHR